MSKKDHNISSVVPYGILALNTVLFGVIRGMIGRRANPTLLQWFGMEFVATLEFCAGCDELGVIGEKHGMAAMGLTMFIMCYIWCRSWFKASASPCDPIEDIVYKQDTAKNVAARVAGQMLAALVSFRYVTFIWSFHLASEHKEVHHYQTKSPLQVSLWMGFIIEGTLMLISRLVQMESSRLEGVKGDVINSMTTVILVLAAADSTGGFFNPALATALKVHCKALTSKQLIVVYWSAPIFGGLAAFFIHKTLHKIEPRVTHTMYRRYSSDPSTRTSAPSTRTSTPSDRTFTSSTRISTPGSRYQSSEKSTMTARKRSE